MKHTVYRMMDHTADLAMEVFGRDPWELYANAAGALYDILVQGPTAGDCEERSFNIGGADRADLMVNWLRELLFLWNGRQQVVNRVTIEALSETFMKAKAMTADYDPDRHRILREIKAVTYHRVAVQQHKSAWRAQIYFDV